MPVKQKKLFARRTRRNRNKLKSVTTNRPRLTVFRSDRNIYAQVISDADGRTLASASSIESGLKSKLKTGADVDAAKAVGQLVAERAKKADVTEVVFDRGGYIYHGRVKALADAAREAGLQF